MAITRTWRSRGMAVAWQRHGADLGRAGQTRGSCAATACQCIANGMATARPLNDRIAMSMVRQLHRHDAAVVFRMHGRCTATVRSKRLHALP